MSADEPEKPETPLEGAEEEIFDGLVAGYRVQPKAASESSGAAEAAYTHGPRKPRRVVDTLPPNREPPIVLNITQPLTVVRRVVAAEPPPTEAPLRSPEDNLTFPLPERRARKVRSRVLIAAIFFAGLFAFAALIRWGTLQTAEPPANPPPRAVATVPATATTPTTLATLVPAPPQAPPTATAALTTAPPVASSPPVVSVRPTPGLPQRPTSAAPPPVVPTSAPPQPSPPSPPPAAPAPAPPSTAKAKDDVSRTF